MTQDELTRLLSDVEAIQQRLMDIARRLHQATGKSASTPSQIVRYTPVEHDRTITPNPELLVSLRCPKCQAALRWQWSPVNGSWFAGCSEFTTQNCRGSMSYAKVTAAMVEAEAEQNAAKPEIEEPSAGHIYRTDDRDLELVTDLERIEKHHGLEAAADWLYRRP